VQAGKRLGGYDFCKFASPIEPAGPTDRTIVPLAGVIQALPLFAFSLQTSTTTKAESFDEPRMFKPAKNGGRLTPALLPVPRPAEVYGGSSRVPEKMERAKAWDESPLDGYFSSASFTDLPYDALSLCISTWAFSMSA